MVAFQRVWWHLNGEEIFVVDSRPCLDCFYFLALSEKERNETTRPGPNARAVSY